MSEFLKEVVNMKYEPGTIIKHKLTKEEFIILSSAGEGAGHTLEIKVRGKDYKEFYFDDTEIEN